MSKNRVFFFIANGVHALDLAGPLQVFYECANYGIPYEIVYVSHTPAVLMSSGLGINNLLHFSSVTPTKDDIIIIPGFDISTYSTEDHSALYKWLNNANIEQSAICSICTGAFALAEAGLLDNIECTTHWKYVQTLQQQFPKIKVLQNKLFVVAGNIYTSAGITTGIDVALYIMELRHGAYFAFRVARELLVYIRRDGSNEQHSIYLQYRQHINDQVHTVQDWIINHLGEKITVEGLATLVYMSPRNLTRLFKATTGITIGEYLEKLRIEKAITLLGAGEKILTVTHACGLKSATALRTILKKNNAHLPNGLA